MTDSDFLFIKPVETVHTIQSLTPAQQREEQKRRQKPPERQQEPDTKPPKETSQEQATDRIDDRHQIDYRA
jgi:hypothetical protein